MDKNNPKECYKMSEIKNFHNLMNYYHTVYFKSPLLMIWIDELVIKDNLWQIHSFRATKWHKMQQTGPNLKFFITW